MHTRLPRRLISPKLKSLPLHLRWVSWLSASCSTPPCVVVCAKAKLKRGDYTKGFNNNMRERNQREGLCTKSTVGLKQELLRGRMNY